MLNVNNSNLIKSKALSPVTSFQSCYSQPGSGLILLENKMRTCTIEECEKKYYCKGYCQMHYARFIRHGDPLYIKRHWMRHTPEYAAWRGMKSRCYNKNIKGYKYYGGRGIIVCKRWYAIFNGFIAFLNDMGLQPFTGAQIDRINNDGNYTPENCRWATITENLRHTSRTKLTMHIAKDIREIYKAGGITQTELGNIYKVDQCTIYDVIAGKTWR